ncbi:hypothetical protein LTR99_008190 [Exophiala xenobiotica]|uniref:Fungal lipase-type domain-containing protein n=1 Tax=Vermiconidia calcicola TaxID=1690605 RepID=A0AAV9QGM0_9PEZI|nr:hypothetical protein H2202_008327 [Exophiala xenobiotica]KAK5539405.1 hypothetical protein LTR23_006626 [Chaetothyriales sp. CCFEE 6169]KAK5543509.1 hypothetical protein LTR25_001123 [Vermiconidia calcicola]KAK5266191.1 hypothetical protein LTR96_008586 [Exophiala xenobiotica]KAK5297787.1 hypothetical protein LTR99_008190 [Exophiala xenobiotica]
MPFLFNGARKRRKSANATAATASAPVYAANPPPPPYALNTSNIFSQQPQRAAQPGSYGGLGCHMASTVDLSPQQGMTDNIYRPLQPHNTWSHPEPPYSAPSTNPAGNELHRKIDDKLGDVISLIDEEAFTGSVQELAISIPDSPVPEYNEPYSFSERDIRRQEKSHVRPKRQCQSKQVNVFSKLDLYLNSRLPASLPPLRVYIPTYPLLCLAAQYSASAYHSPQSPSERKDFVSADNRLGTKTMVIKSIPCDDKNTVVFAIRGTSMLSMRDWGINLSTDPVSPAGFLDDQGNLCHSGFLKVAKAMARPIATRLRQLLEENPSRTSCSLLITGHSAGGAVASLLYAHMLATTVQSDLNMLTGCFKRVHCITFGAPPISLLPLQKPDTADGRLKKCLFHSFINEGDPVARAERTYIKSLVDLLSRPVPQLQQQEPAKTTASPLNMLGASMSRLDLSLNSNPNKKKNNNHQPAKPKKQLVPTRKMWWEVPPATFSNAGRLVVLRVPDGGTESDVTACIVRDEQLRQVVFGDPLMHAMDLYARRIETLAVRAVTGKTGLC